MSYINLGFGRAAFDFGASKLVYEMISGVGAASNVCVGLGNFHYLSCRDV